MRSPLYIRSVARISEYTSEAAFERGAREALPALDLSLLRAPLRRGLSDVTRLFMHVAGAALQECACDPSDVALVFASAFGELATAEALLALAYDDNTSSPVRFRHSVHNAAPGLLSISAHNVLAHTAIAAGWDTVAMALLETSLLLEREAHTALLVFAEERVPTTLSGDHRYGPLAVAMVLARSPGPGDKGALSDLRHAPSRASSLAAARASTDTQASFGPENHPLGQALRMAFAIEARATRTLIVGERPYTVAFRRGETS